MKDKKIKSLMFIVLPMLALLFVSLSSYGQTYDIKTYNGTTQTVGATSVTFTDNPSGSYSNNEDYTMTFCSSTGNYLAFEFAGNLNMDTGTGDTLFFYDGTTATGTPIAFLTKSDDVSFTQLMINTLSTCVTVRWKSDGSGVDGGWSAVLKNMNPPTCATNSPAADIFGQATFICNFDNYCGTTAGYYGEDLPYNLSGGGDCPSPDDGIFGGTIENNSWLKFIASSASSTFNFNATDCGVGLQVAIFEFNGSTFSLKSPCNMTDGAHLGSFTLTASGLTVGQTYYIMIDGNAGDGCDYTINAVTGIAAVDAGPDQSVCTNSTTLAATAGTTGTWSVVPGFGSGTFANPTSPNSTVSGLSLGVNKLRWTASTICNSSTDDVTITVITCTCPTATISYAGAPFCKTVTTAQAVTLAGTGSYTGGTYSVSPSTGLTINATTGAITPSTSTAGNYTVTYTIAAAGACPIITATANVTITAPPTATISYAGPFCNSISTSQAVTLTGTTGGAFSATPAGLTINASTGAITPSSSTANPYTVNYTIAAAGGCAAVTIPASVTINAAPTASLSYSSGVFCKSVVGAQPATLTGSGGTYSVSPSTGLTINLSTGAITPSSSTAGPYVISYTIPASAGCSAVTATANVTISAAPAATISYTGNSFCSSLPPQAVVLTGTTGGSYSVSPATGLTINNSTGEITPSSSTGGTYVVTYTIPAAGGCLLVSDTANVTITQASTASITYSGSPFCSSLTAPQAVALTGTAGGSYTTTPSGLTINASGAITPSTSTAGNYVVTYFIPASGGCASVSDTAYVTVTTAPSATISYSGSPYCTSVLSAQTVNLTGTSGGVYNATPSGLSISSSTGSITPSASTPGNYTISYSISAAGGCPLVQAQTAVAINGLPTIIISGTTALCTGGTTTLTATGATTYSWSNGDTGPSITVTPTMSSNIYTVTGTQFGCVNTANATVVVNSPPTVVITGTDTICFGGTTTLTASGASSYLWSHNGSSSNSITVFPQATTTYTVSGTTNGCTSTQSYTVVVLSKPVIVLTTTDPGCNINNGVVQSLVSGGMGNYTYSWSNGSAFSAISNLAPGSYILTVSDGYCSSTASATLLDPNNLKAAMYINPQTTNILEGDVVFKDVSEGNPVSWIWSFGDGTASSGTPVVQHHYSELGTYPVQLIIQNSAGCSDTIQDTVVVEDVFTLYVPNALSVDNNTTNDGFSAYGNCVDPTRFKMDIYDRWGGLLFTANQWVDNKSFPAWNGCKNNVGVKLPLGVYVYRITLADTKGRFYRKVGSVSIVK